MEALAKLAKEFVFIGRCSKKGCKSAFRIVQSGRIVNKWTRGFVGVPGSAQKFQVTEPIWPSVEIWCASHHRPVSWAIVKGVKSDHVCDARCTSAKGHNCECSCGGANHGKDFAI